jgi:cobalt/nickel transport protein
VPDYVLPGDESAKGLVAAYYLSAILGVIICGGFLYLAGKKIAKN